MAHFAELGTFNRVLRVIVVANEVLLDENGIENEQLGIDFCKSLYGGEWIQTSFNATFRKHFAAPDYTYDTIRDVFIPPRPFNSWVLNTNTFDWETPVPYPIDGSVYSWDENTTSWILIPS